MIYFRRQQLTLRDQEAITLRFGEFGTDAYTGGIEGHPNVQPVIREADEAFPFVFGGSWHTDSPFLERPPSIGILYGVDIPPYGGDTWWANSTLAYQFLSERMREMLRHLRVHMSARNVLHKIKSYTGDGNTMKVGSTEIHPQEELMIEGACHPLVRTHPETGEQALYVDQTYSVCIQGMTDAESSCLIDFLCSHITQPIFTCRLRWEPGTLAMWDNRSCLHHAFNDHHGMRREMRRTIVEGEVPV